MKPDLWITGYIGESPNTAVQLEAALDDEPAKIALNSPGGDAVEGAAMQAVLDARKGDTLIIVGIAASAASLLAMGADKILIHRSAMIMIHDPIAMTIGPAELHQKTARDLEKMAGVYAEAYSRATGHDVSRVAKWMLDETWLTAEEAVELNFADGIWEGNSEAVAACDYKQFRCAPSKLVRQSVKNGWSIELEVPA